jgi:predicted secreted protein
MIHSLLEERTARLRSIGLRGALSIDPTTWRRMLKSTVAGTLAWEAAALIHSPRPVLASLGAVLAVQVTVSKPRASPIHIPFRATLGQSCARMAR